LSFRLRRTQRNSSHRRFKFLGAPPPVNFVDIPRSEGQMTPSESPSDTAGDMCALLEVSRIPLIEGDVKPKLDRGRRRCRFFATVERVKNDQRLALICSFLQWNKQAKTIFGLTTKIFNDSQMICVNE